MRAAVLCLASLLALTACDKLPGGLSGITDEDEKTDTKGVKKKKKAETKRVEVDWKDERTFVVEGDSKKKGEVAVHDGTYQVTLHGFPKGTTWKAGDEKGEVDSDIYDILKLVEVEDRFGTLPAGDAMKGKIDPKLTLTVDEPDGQQIEVELPAASAASSAHAMLERVENGPVLFGKEKPDDKPNENVLYLAGTLSWKLFGKAQTLAEVDRIAIAHQRDEVKGTKTCSGYKDNAGKAMPDLEIQLKETEVKVYDRRKGDVVEEKVFPPDNECPMFAFQSKDDNKKDSSIPTQAIESWLRSLVGR